jgi:hypothetical protein
MERDSRYPDIKTGVYFERIIDRAENVHKKNNTAIIWHIFGFELGTQQNLIETST